jgi:hypothetical protein
MQVMQNTVANDVHARIKKALDPGGLFVSSRYLQVDRGFNEQAQRPGLPGNAAR